MEIKKLDREKAEQEAEKKAAAFSEKKAELRALKKAQQEKESKKLSRRKIVIYCTILCVLAVISVTYNVLEYRNAHEPPDSEAITPDEQLTIMFEELCDDIESAKAESGVYPESIDDLVFSKYLKYFRTSVESFRLIYNDGSNHLTYDSSTDFETLN
jgi:hypothetical protein